MIGRIRKLLTENKGSALVLVCGALLALMGFVALTLDVGQMVLWKAKAASAADAAAIAGAWELPSTSAADSRARYLAACNDISSVNVGFENNDQRIAVTASKDLDLLFSPVLGYEHTVVSATAVAEKGCPSAIFDWAMFSGSKLDWLKISSPYVDGSVHTNDSVKGVGNGTVTGKLSAHDGITLAGSMWNVGFQEEDADYIDMLNFDPIFLSLKAKAQSGGTYYTGDQNLDGRYLQDNEVIYVEGDVTVNGSFSGTGSIIATGDITFNGSHELTSEDSVFICTTGVGKEIVCNGSSVTDGILFAPKGTVVINGGSVIHGRVVGYRVEVNGGFEIYGRNANNGAVPGGETVRLVG